MKRKFELTSAEVADILAKYCRDQYGLKEPYWLFVDVPAAADNCERFRLTTFTVIEEDSNGG